MSRITKQDTNGVKPLLSTGELGYDNYPAGGDVGRVYVGTGAANIALAKKTEVIGVDGKADAHIARVDNPHNVTKAQVGLANVDNTSDAAKNVLSATKLTTPRNISLTGDVTGSVSFDGTGNVSINSTVGDDSHNHVISNIDGLQTALNLKADSASPIFTGIVSGITKSMVGLSNVDNTSDASKPVSTAQQTALNLKANLDSPTFTGTVTLPTNTINKTNYSGFFLNKNTTCLSNPNFNDITPNSINCTVNNSIANNGPHTNTGMIMDLSSIEHGLDGAEERAGQIFIGDTDASGMYVRGKQGSLGWKSWKKMTNDFAYKEGPSGHAGNYRSTYAASGGVGSLDHTSASDGIIITETGYYHCYSFARVAAGGYWGIGLNGDRNGLESRTDNFWGHDHNAAAAQWSHSVCIGLLQAGWKITSGAASPTYAPASSVAGHDGGLIIWRLF